MYKIVFTKMEKKDDKEWVIYLKKPKDMITCLQQLF